MECTAWGCTIVTLSIVVLRKKARVYIVDEIMRFSMIKVI